jgi:DNA-binding response OmpR family regulator
MELEDRILIVDDEKMIYSVVARRLAKEGYACVMANNGKETPSQGDACG